MEKGSFNAPIVEREGGVELVIPEDVIDKLGLSEGEEVTVEFVSYE